MIHPITYRVAGAFGGYLVETTLEALAEVVRKALPGEFMVGIQTIAGKDAVVVKRSERHQVVAWTVFDRWDDRCCDMCSRPRAWHDDVCGAFQAAHDEVSEPFYQAKKAEADKRALDEHRAQQEAERRAEEGLSSAGVELRRALRQHDWFYEFSDDGRVYRNGNEQRNRIVALCRETPIDEVRRLWAELAPAGFAFPSAATSEQHAASPTIV